MSHLLPAGPAETSALLGELEAGPRPSSRLLPRLGEALYRSRGAALLLVLLGVLAGAALSWLVAPVYTAQGALVVERPNPQPAELHPSETPAYDEDREIQTEMTELASRTVAGRVIARLDLTRLDPEMAQALARARRAGPLDATSTAQIATGVFGGQLALVPDKLSRTVRVQFRSRDPRLAASAVNGLMEEFVDYTRGARAATGQALADWLRGQLQGERDRFQRDEAALVRFQQQHAFTPLVVPGGQQNVLLEQLVVANRQLTESTAARITSEALLATYTGTVSALPAELRTPAIDQAVSELSAAERALDLLQVQYQPGFPLLEQARERVSRSRARVAALGSQVQQGLEKRVRVARRQEAELAALVTRLSQRAAGESTTELEYQVLENRAAAQRRLNETLNEKLQEAGLLASLPTSNVWILDHATRPLTPLYPRLPLNLGLGLALGLAAALATALARERWSGAITAGRAGLQLRGRWLPPLGLIPEARRRGAASLGRAAAGESYARLAAQLVARLAPPASCLLTSSNPGEGKTRTTCELGLALARLGWRTLLVDADLRRPGCHRFFGVENFQGLLAAQQGGAPALHVAPNLDLLPCENAPEAQLLPRRLAELLAEWRTRYDYVLFDTPPGRLTGEAALLAPLVGGVLLVLRWGHTSEEEAQALGEELARARAPLLGTVLNRADLNAPEFRYYRQHAAYYRRGLAA